MSTKALIRILLADDFEPILTFVSSMLERQPGLQVIGVAHDGLEAVQKAEDLRPDLIVLDISLPKLNGIEAARKIRIVSPRSIILFLSANSSPDIALEAIRTGARGYVIKADAAEDLLVAVDAVLIGKRFISHRFARYGLIR